MQRKFSAGEAKICLLSECLQLVPKPHSWLCESFAKSTLEAFLFFFFFFFSPKHKKQENPFRQTSLISSQPWLGFLVLQNESGDRAVLSTRRSRHNPAPSECGYIHRCKAGSWMSDYWASPLPPSHSRRCWSSCHACHWLPGTGHRWTWHTLQSSSECRCRSLCSTSWCTSHQPLLCCCGDTNGKRAQGR